MVTTRDRGTIQTMNLKVGDYVQNQYGIWTMVVWIRQHLGMHKHVKLTFSDGFILVLTPDHLAYDSNQQLLRAEDFHVGDTVYGSDAHITAVETVMDVTSTPCVYEGAIVYGNKLVSCWAKSAVNAGKMDQLMGLAKEMRETLLVALSDDAFAQACEDFYTQYKAYGSKKGSEMQILEKIVARMTPDFQQNKIISLKTK